MAYEKLYGYTKDLAAKYKSLEAVYNAATGDSNRELRHQLFSSKIVVFDCLRNYLETVLLIPKFKDQRRYCIEVMTELNSVYMEGYLQSKAKSPKRRLTKED